MSTFPSLRSRSHSAAPIELELRSPKRSDAVSGVDAQHINSSITDGVASTTITFRLGTDTDRALNDVKDAVTRIRADLPRSIDEPMVQRIDIAGLPILTYAAIAPGKTPEQLSWFVEDVVIRGLQGIRGVGSIERIGSVEREIRVGLDPVRLQAVGLTALDVSRQLRGSNVDLAGGRAEIGGRNQAIRTLTGARRSRLWPRPESLCRPAARFDWTIWASSPIRLRSRAPLPGSTALPW
jgi:multidrug efflux pump subunit AcrB